MLMKYDEVALLPSCTSKNENRTWWFIRIKNLKMRNKKYTRDKISYELVYKADYGDEVTKDTVENLVKVYKMHKKEWDNDSDYLEED